MIAVDMGMRAYVGFLRAINVAGHATVRKNALKQAFVAAGCKDVRTFIQSGNVRFTCPRDSAAVFRMIQTNLRELIGHEVTVVYRTLDELDALVGRNPFKKMTRTKNKKLYLTFLSCKPGKTARFPIESAKEALQAMGTENLDIFTVSGPKQNGFYGYPNNFIEAQLGVSATTRNWSTVTKIVEFARVSRPVLR